MISHIFWSKNLMIQIKDRKDRKMPLMGPFSAFNELILSILSYWCKNGSVIPSISLLAELLIADRVITDPKQTGPYWLKIPLDGRVKDVERTNPPPVPP